MTGYLTIAADDAKKLCGRLEFDASWDKAGPGYYELNKQIKSNLSVGVGSFIAYNYSSILSAMSTRLTAEEGEAPVSDCGTAIKVRNELLGELTVALKDDDTLVRLIANEPALVLGRLDRAPVDWDMGNILKGKILLSVTEALNGVIAGHLISSNKHVNPAIEYAKCVAEVIGKWQRKHKKEMGSFAYDRSEQLIRHLDLLTKGKEIAFVRSEIAKFVSREIRDKSDLRSFFVADEVLALVGALKHARKAKKNG